MKKVLLMEEIEGHMALLLLDQNGQVEKIDEDEDPRVNDRSRYASYNTIRGVIKDSSLTGVFSITIEDRWSNYTHSVVIIGRDIILDKSVYLDTLEYSSLDERELEIVKDYFL